MQAAIRVVSVLLLVELLLCGWSVTRQWRQSPTVLPRTALVDDPLFREQLQELADTARKGGGLEYRALAEALLGHGFYAEAEQNFRAALQHFSEDHSAQFGLALCLDRTGRIRECITAYERAAELPAKTSGRTSRREHCLYAIGTAWLKLEDSAAAEAAFRANRGFVPAEYQLAKLLLRAGRTAEAESLINTHLQRSPQSLFFNFLKMRLCQDQGLLAAERDAADQLDRAQYDLELNFNTEFIDPLNRRYGLNAESEAYDRLLQTGNMDLVAAKLQSVLATVQGLRLPHRLSLLMRLGETELQRENPAAILAAMTELQGLGVENADTLQLTGAAYDLQGDPAGAAALWLQAAEMSPNVQLHLRLAQHYADQDDTAARDKHRAQAALLTAKLQYWSNQFEAARQAAEETTALDVNSSQGWFYLGECARQLGDATAAQAAYNRCVQLDPQHGRAALRLAQAQSSSRAD